MTKRGYRRNAHARNQLDEVYRKMFRCDAFISYANEDKYFALHETKQEVELETKRTSSCTSIKGISCLDMTYQKTLQMLFTKVEELFV